MTYDINKDYDLWLQEQADLLRSHSFKDLDINNLVGELEALVRGEKSAVEGFAYQIMLHLLLVDYWKEESESNRNQRCDPLGGFLRLTKGLPACARTKRLESRS